MPDEEILLGGLLLGVSPLMLLSIALLASLVAWRCSGAKLSRTPEVLEHTLPSGVPAAHSDLSRGGTEGAMRLAHSAVQLASSQAQSTASPVLGNSFHSDFTSEAQQDAARAQTVSRNSDSCDVWPEFWGISLEQCQNFLAECRQDPNWDDTNSLAVMVLDYVIPKTRGHGLGLALLLNREEPKEVNIMVSHAWQENAKDFVETLARTVSKTDVMFICAFSLYQCEDGTGPSIKEQLGSEARESPFRRVLFYIRSKGRAWGFLWAWESTLKLFPNACCLYGLCLYSAPMVVNACIPTLDGCAALKSSKWEYVSGGAVELDACVIGAVVSLLVALVVHLAVKALRIYKGRIVAVPNHECDLYTRLWCVYEIYVAAKMQIPMEMAKTLASCGSCSSQEATCTNLEDQNRIRTEIERTVPIGSGYGRVDKAVLKLKRSAQRSALWILCTNGPMLSVCGTAAARCLLSDSIDAMCMFGIICGIWLAGAMTCGLVCTLSKPSSGLPTCRRVVRSIVWPFGLAALSALLFFLLWVFLRSSVPSFVFGALGALAVSFVQSAVSLALLALFARTCRENIGATSCHLERFLLPSAVIVTLLIVLLISIGFEGPRVPRIILYAFVSAWALGRFQSIWTLSVEWGVAIADHRLALKCKQRTFAKPKESALATYTDFSHQEEEDSESWSL